MKISRSLFLSLCLATTAYAGTGRDFSTVSSASTAAATESVIPFEFDVEYAHMGDGSVERGFRHVEFDENYYAARFIYRPRTPIGYLRLGVAYERFDFGVPDFIFATPGPTGFFFGRTQVPETLQSVSAVVGLDTKFSDSLLFRIEAQPGYYGTNHLGSETFNVPVVIGGTYLYSENLQFIFGVSVNYERKYPVLPGGGVRWRFAPQWVLNAAVPTPRLEYEATRNFTIYAGADLKGSTFRVDNDFGTSGGLLSRRDARLNRAVLTYSEVRTGLGVDWKLTPDIKFSLEGGYVPYREFDFHRADVRYKNDKGAPYGAVALRAAF
ncbi:MAG: DUF6268 family outer membrane beta-barrel protein [Chthoniobacterales bacterium]